MVLGKHLLDETGKETEEEGESEKKVRREGHQLLEEKEKDS
jgi:hypothetical protein